MSRPEVLRLYRDMLRGALRFSDYNYRMFALTRVVGGFRAAKTASASDAPVLMKQGVESLGLIQRQSQISQMYRAPGDLPSVIEPSSRSRSLLRAVAGLAAQRADANAARA